MSTEQMSRDHIRSFYGIPVKRGMRIVFDGKPGKITGFRDRYLLVRLDDEPPATRNRSPLILHPTWRVEYPEIGRKAMTE